MVTLPTPPDALRAYSLNSAAQRLDTSPPALRARVRRGSVHAARIGARYYITEAELARLLAPIDIAPSAQETDTDETHAEK